MRVAKTAKSAGSRTIKLNGKEYVFYLYVNYHRNGFVHYAVCNGIVGRACWCNRTWEKYPFYSAIAMAARSLGNDDLYNAILEA